MNADTPATRPGPGRRRPTASPDRPAARPAPPLDLVSEARPAMGGRLGVHLQSDPEDVPVARRDARRVLARVTRWAGPLSRHDPDSELAALNADARPEVPVRPTLHAALRAAIEAADATDGFVDATLLDARLAAEAGAVLPAHAHPPDATAGAPHDAQDRRWRLQPDSRGAGIVERGAGVRFDLGGVAKGWLADRAIALLQGWPTALVDADGDLAVRSAEGARWDVGVDDPREPGALLAILRLEAPRHGFARWGVATSGTSVHRWRHGDRTSHHLIDPRTGRPAVTDLVQATVVCRSALRAEALAKAAVIAGTVEGLALLDRCRVDGAVVLTARGDTLALPVTLPLLRTAA